MGRRLVSQQWQWLRDGIWNDARWHNHHPGELRAEHWYQFQHRHLAERAGRGRRWKSLWHDLFWWQRLRNGFPTRDAISAEFDYRAGRRPTRTVVANEHGRICSAVIAGIGS